MATNWINKLRSASEYSSYVLIEWWFYSRKVLIKCVHRFEETVWSLSPKIGDSVYFIIWQTKYGFSSLLLDDVVLGRCCEDLGFMEDFSDMLLLKLLHTSITAADDNEKVCAVYNDSDTIEVFWSLFGIHIKSSRRNQGNRVLYFNHFCSSYMSYSYFSLTLYSVLQRIMVDYRKSSS